MQKLFKMQMMFFVQLAGYKYVSKFGLCKGYWQLPLENLKSARKTTAFQTPLGLYQLGDAFWTGKCLGKLYSTNEKVVRRDAFYWQFHWWWISFTRTFQDHLLVVEEFLHRLKTANLTVEPSKCSIAFSSIECKGYIARNDKLKPIPDKVEAIRNCSRPAKKKQVKPFLGLVGFYRKFIPNFPAVACVSVIRSDQERTTKQSRVERFPAKRLPYVNNSTHGDASLEVTQHQRTVHLTDICIRYRYRSRFSSIRKWYQENSRLCQ